MSLKKNEMNDFNNLILTWIVGMRSINSLKKCSIIPLTLPHPRPVSLLIHTHIYFKKCRMRNRGYCSSPPTLPLFLQIHVHSATSLTRDSHTAFSWLTISMMGGEDLLRIISIPRKIMD
jgi:hypothetical protein